jgi:hypothetical protein
MRRIHENSETCPRGKGAVDDLAAINCTGVMLHVPLKWDGKCTSHLEELVPEHGYCTFHVIGY